MGYHRRSTTMNITLLLLFIIYKGTLNYINTQQCTIHCKHLNTYLHFHNYKFCLILFVRGCRGLFGVTFIEFVHNIHKIKAKQLFAFLFIG